MKKSILMVTGIAGMLLGSPLTDALAEVNIRVGPGGRPASVIVIDNRPDFIYLSKPGFYVSFNGPYDIVFYANRYYLFRDGVWYRASHYRGPWVVVRHDILPGKIRHYRWEDLRRYRDHEYRRHDRRYWDNRFEHDRRR
ncbi:MAG: BcpO-related WXXGXW repeat protein, partial [Chlorobiaceae bacterium]|nr:BcpO-related WXXGXW repeat protein [Chlorobiaceae bacterium]